MPQSRSEAVTNWLEQKRSTLSQTDTLRLNGDIVTSLRHLLKQPSPYRSMQLDYLLCYHLMQKDVRSFANDYLRYALAPAASGTERQVSLHGLYAEAMMIYLASTPEAQHNNITWHFPEDMIQRFKAYSNRYQESGGSAKELYADYGSTYWFYVHFAQRKGGTHHE